MDTPKRPYIKSSGGVFMAGKYDREFKVEAIRLAA
jgi:hypothetical protein